MYNPHTRLEVNPSFPPVHAGENHIVRKSTESAVTVPDVPSTLELHNKAEEALSSNSDLHLEDFQSATGLPNRLLLPKGNYAGMEYKLVVLVTDYQEDVNSSEEDLHSLTGFHHYGHHGHYHDKRPHGYPLERPVPDDRVFHEIPNFKETIVKVYDYGEHIKPFGH